MSKLKLFFINFFPALIVSFLLVILVYAWTEPSKHPPYGNVPAPINVGTSTQSLQTMEGSLIITNSLSVGGGLLVFGGGGLSGGSQSVVPVLKVAGDKVGIGISMPNDKLHVEGGNIYSSEYVIAGRGLCIGGDCITSFQQSGGTGGGTNYWASSGNNIYNTNSGNVGIGTSTPPSTLSVLGNLTILRMPGVQSTGIGYAISLQSPSPGSVATERSEWEEIENVSNVSDTCDGNKNNRYLCEVVKAGQTCTDIASFSEVVSEEEKPILKYYKSTVTCVQGTDVYSLRTNAGTLEFLNTRGVVKMRIDQDGHVAIIGNVTIGTTTRDILNDLRVEGSVAAYRWVTLSDIKLKKDIQPLNFGVLDKVLQLNPVSFYWYNDQIDKEKHFGFIAQEVEKIFPELVRADSKGYKTIDYNELIPYLVQAIKEQQKEIEELKKQLHSF